MELFDAIKAIFSKKDWQKVSQDDKYKYSFLIFRVISINHPVEINMCQPIGMGKRNTCLMLDSWNIVLSNKYVGCPKWVYTKNGTKESVDNQLKGLDKDLISAYMVNRDITEKDLIFLNKIYGKELRAEILAYKKTLTQ